MALTASEEALVRQLLDQQAAILSLAGNEATITSKLGATKVTLADLVAASGVADADLLLMRQGTTDKSVTPLVLKGYAQDGMATQKAVQAGDYNTSVAGGTADAITGDYTPNVLALENGLTLFVRASAANTTTTPTFAPDGLTAKTIVKGNNLALAAGDIAGAGHWLEMNFDTTLDKWVLQNPYVSAQVASAAEAQALADNVKIISPLRLADAFKGANSSVSGNGYQKFPSGLIIQWGSVTFPDIGGTASVSVTFPITFPNGIFNIVDALGLTGGFNTAAAVNESTITASGFQAVISEWNAVTQTGGKYRWLAIGW